MKDIEHLVIPLTHKLRYSEKLLQKYHEISRLLHSQGTLEFIRKSTGNLPNSVKSDIPERDTKDTEITTFHYLEKQTGGDSKKMSFKLIDVSRGLSEFRFRNTDIKLRQIKHKMKKYCIPVHFPCYAICHS